MMDDPHNILFTQTFNFHGRVFWLDIAVMNTLNYCYAYGVDHETGAAALKYKYEFMDFTEPNVKLYEAYLKYINEGHDIPGETAYLKSKLYNIIDKAQGKVADTMKAIEMIMDLTIANTGLSKSALSKLSFEELLKLADKMRDA
jgi:hypothetical protein